MPTDVDDQASALAWITYEGGWGERQSGFWNGPTGPNTKERWLEPVSWEAGLREFSYRVGRENRGGLSPVNVFCTVISFGGRITNLDATNPLLARTLGAGLLTLIIGLFNSVRQTLGAALRLYLRHPIAFGALGLAVIPAAVVVNVIQVPLALLPPVDVLLTLTERSPATGLLYALSATSVLSLPVLIFVGPAVVQAVGEATAGQSPRLVTVCRRTLDRLPLLATTAVRVWLPIVVLVVSVVGIPWAIARAGRWAFVAQAVILDTAPSAGAAVAVSAGAVRGCWWRAFRTLLVLVLLVAVLPPVAGVALMFESNWSLAWITTLSGILAAALIPLALIGATLLYRELRKPAMLPDPVSV